jgi:hypothetical protein
MAIFRMFTARSNCFSISSTSCFSQAILKKPSRRFSGLCADKLRFDFCTRAPSLPKAFSQVCIAFSTLDEMSLSGSTSFPIFPSISSMSSSRSSNRSSSSGASLSVRKNRRISRTESTSWIARETTAMPLAAALSPSISSRSRPSMTQTKAN